jgi:predicted Zn-dependent protease
MIPLLAASNKSRSLENIRIGVIDDPSINAANAGGGEFYVTTGSSAKSNRCATQRNIGS